jgi:hypothetical protein
LKVALRKASLRHFVPPARTDCKQKTIKGEMKQKHQGRGFIAAHVSWEAFQEVVKAYMHCKEGQPLGASTIYLDDGERSNRLTILGLEYIIDIELATRAALKDDANLLEVWTQLALEQPTDPNQAHDVTQRCGREYIKRALPPAQYFKVNRYPQRRKAA